MSDPYSIHAEAVASVMIEQGDNCPRFTWNGSTYLAQARGGRGGKENSPGGFTFDSDLALVVNMDQFDANTNPDELRNQLLQTTIQYQAKKYRVTQVTVFPGGKQIRIECIDAMQKL